jgi:hypothetical protein
MIAFKKLTGIIAKISMGSIKPAFAFSQDGWKKRDEAAEKVYITEQ